MAQDFCSANLQTCYTVPHARALNMCPSTPPHPVATGDSETGSVSSGGGGAGIEFLPVHPGLSKQSEQGRGRDGRGMSASCGVRAQWQCAAKLP